MARGGVEVAAWDLEARMLGKPLYQHIGGGRASRNSVRSFDRHSGFGRRS